MSLKGKGHTITLFMSGKKINIFLTLIRIDIKLKHELQKVKALVFSVTKTRKYNAVKIVNSLP